MVYYICILFFENIFNDILGGYQNIIGLSATPVWPFAPSCPGCGQSCDAGNDRLYVLFQDHHGIH